MFQVQEDITQKKAAARMIATALRIGVARDSAASTGPALEVTENIQSEIKEGMLRLAIGKAVSNCAVLGEEKKMVEIWMR
ncbi:hypothetical protein PoB_003352700 [Plakobranchus ocellatus]|uniref:Uncharacterized protein n=1 Tax=Plakobranchus ocellatus TaxID=259542 RepID=A0AAV4AJ45_9GAST|nr:hypothetical protein PoB_003352700 [Plakobranchus ocellatus]